MYIYLYLFTYLRLKRVGAAKRGNSRRQGRQDTRPAFVLVAFAVCFGFKLKEIKRRSWAKTLSGLLLLQPLDFIVDWKLFNCQTFLWPLICPEMRRVLRLPMQMSALALSPESESESSAFVLLIYCVFVCVYLSVFAARPQVFRQPKPNSFINQNCVKSKMYASLAFGAHARTHVADKTAREDPIKSMYLYICVCLYM